MKLYTIGALFDMTLNFVVLINKKRPAWQSGKFNLPGGHFEYDEVPDECIAREFEEEVGIIIPPFKWNHIGVIENYRANGNGYACHLLTSKLDLHAIDVTIHNKTDERAYWFSINNIPPNALSNLHWLIPFAKNYLIGGELDHINFGTFKYED